MERYETKTGTYDILRYTDECVVVKNAQVVYSGTYTECRKYIEARK